MNNTQQRKVTADFITNILSLDTWKSHTEQVMVYANLVARLTHDEELETSIMAQSAALAAKALKVDVTDEEFREACFRCNKKVHRLLDDDDEYIWSDKGTLGSKWERDQQAEAQALLEATPPAFMPTQTPDLLGDYAFHKEAHLIKNRSEQHRKHMPTCYEAMDALYSQGYRLNKDIMALKNLPMDLNIGKNYAAKSIALQNSEQFNDEFFFKYTMDSRGRIYARSLIVTPQGASFDKAVLNFSEAKPLGQYGFQALMIHYANCSGHDKISFVDRMKWARNEGTTKAIAMEACNGDWSKISELIEDTKHGFEEYAAAMEMFQAWTEEIIGQGSKHYRSALVTHQDATNSGFQFGAALTGDRELAFDVNITSNFTKDMKPADLYGKMATNLKPLVQHIQDSLPMIDRKFCKKPIMVTGYGAGITAVVTDIQEEHPDMIDDDLMEELKEPIKEALHLTASGMLDLTEIVRDIGSNLMDDGLDTITWVAQDGFRIIQQYRDKSAREVKLNKYNVSYTKLEKGQVDPIDEKKMGTALPPNFIHSIDAQLLRTTALNTAKANVALSPIHDSFGTHAATFFDLNLILKEAFVTTMEYDWYGSLVRENMVENTPDIKTGDYQARECLKAVYMFS